MSPTPGSGLEDQLLGQVVAEERPDLEEAKNQLIVNNAKMRQELKDIEDQILYRLSSSEGNPVDDMELIKVLEASKLKAAEIQVSNCRPTPACLSPPAPGLPPIATHLCLVPFDNLPGPDQHPLYCTPRPRSGLQSRQRRTLTSRAWSTFPWPSAPRSSSSACLTWPTWTPCTSTPSSGFSTSSSQASPTQRGQVALAQMHMLT